MVVQANYNSKKNPSVALDSSSYSITNGTDLKTGQTSVTITFEDKSVNQPITVQENSVVQLEIKTPPTKVSYYEGENFDRTGMVIEATYKNGTKKVITDYTISDEYTLKANQTKVTISYGEKTVEQPITVIPNPLVQIAVTKAPNKVKYVVGQNFDKTGIVVTGTYQNGMTQEILDYIIENGNSLTKGQSSITIKYEGKSTSQAITVEEKSITGISVSKKPSKLQYIQNKEELDLTGGIIEVTYNDATTESIEMTSDEVSATGFSNSKLGTLSITLTYQSKTTQYEVEIIGENAENSKMVNAVANVKNVKAYYFTEDSQKDYTLIEIEINGIEKSINNDKLEYYYYLSSNENEENITDWVKIEESQTENNNLKFTINTTEFANYNEISNSEVLYLYLKEVATKGGNQSVAISNSMKLESNVEVETYINNAKKENNNSGNHITNTPDDTIAKDHLPNTGSKTFVIISAIVLIATICIICYIKYNKFRDII